MKQVRMVVEVNNIVEVKVNENIWTEQAIKEWSDFFYNAETVEDIARLALSSVLNLGQSAFIDGFGYMKINGDYPIGVDDDEKCKSIEIVGLDINWEVSNW